MYFIPGQMMIPTLIGSADSIAGVRTLGGLVDKVVSGNDTYDFTMGTMSMARGVPPEQRAELFFGDLKQLYDIMWLASAPAIVDDNRLDTTALETFLEALKAISDKYNLTNPGDNNQVSMAMGFSDGGAITLPDSLTRYAVRETNLAAYNADHFKLLEHVLSRNDSTVAEFPGLTPGAWQPIAIAAISADTEVVDFALEFINTMFSVGVQRINYGAGLPVTRAGVAEQIEGLDEILLPDAMELAAFKTNMDSLIGSLSVPSTHDSTLAVHGDHRRRGGCG
jgi:hypothetical protein